MCLLLLVEVPVKYCMCSSLMICLHTVICCQVFLYDTNRGIACGVVVKLLDSDIKISEFQPQSCYYVFFQTNYLGKCITPPNSPHPWYGLIVPLLFFYKHDIGIK